MTGVNFIYLTNILHYWYLAFSEKNHLKINNFENIFYMSNNLIYELKATF